MNKIKIISKQWSITLRDFFKSLYYGAIVPALVLIQGLIESGGFIFDWYLVPKIVIGAVVAHIIRKFVEPSRKIEITPLAVELPPEDPKGGDNGGGNHPPPIGDPTHPKKPKE